MKPFDWLFYNVIDMTIRLPLWVMVLLIATPIVAYADLVLIGHATFWKYFAITLIEMFLFVSGYIVGVDYAARVDYENRNNG